MELKEIKSNLTVCKLDDIFRIDMKILKMFPSSLGGGKKGITGISIGYFVGAVSYLYFFS